MIRHVYGDRFPLGEPSGEITADVQRLSEDFTAAGMQAPVLDRIRDEIWLKLWGNVCLNPISALTHATLDVICSDPGHARAVEGDHAGGAGDRRNFGVKFRVDVERRIEGARKVGAHKTSMLQDLERGRPMEIDPLVTVVQEMGRLTRITDAGRSMRCWRWSPSAQDRRTLRWNGSSVQLKTKTRGELRDGKARIDEPELDSLPHQGATGFGTLTQSDIACMTARCSASKPSGRKLTLGDVELLAPSEPSKIVALWNNFHALAAKLNQPEPPEPLYLLKATTTISGAGRP